MGKDFYQILDHTADIGMRVQAKDLSGLFRNAGLALFDISAQKVNPSKTESHQMVVMQKGANAEELLVNWLNQLLYLSQTESMVFEDFKINQVSDKFIDAVAVGVDMNHYKVNTEIKAATYHELKLSQTPRGYQAQVVFDV
ncbi:MAG: archease [Candidatus Omnitrophica bacterium]|jgi:SHS2 domain-containing protein|nr:archease [Candidatus Omnitrophota bacterium]